MKSLPENSVLTPRRTNTTVIPCAGLILLYLLGCICAFQIRSLDVSQYSIHLGCTGEFFSQEAVATAQASDGYLWLTGMRDKIANDLKSAQNSHADSQPASS